MKKCTRKNVQNTQKDKKTMTEPKLKMKNENQNKIQVIYFELSFVLVTLMILIHSLSFLSGINENFFAYKISADIVLSAVCVTAEYIFIHKTYFKDSIKKYALCFLLFFALSANLILFSSNVHCLILSAAYIYINSIFKEKKNDLFSLFLCVLLVLIS